MALIGANNSTPSTQSMPSASAGVSTGLPIRMVVPTTHSQENFFKTTMTGRSLLACQNAGAFQLRLFENNTKGLAEVYNQAIDEAQNDPAILIFIHDDVLICDFHWQKRVRDALKKFQVLGVAGNTRRLPAQPGWIMINTNKQLDNYAYLSGAIGQDTQFPPGQLDVFGPAGLECKLLDGVFLAVSSHTLHSTGLRFDPQFKFHFYDLDFCRSAEQLKVTMGTVDVSLVHASLGHIDNVWNDSYNLYIQKWKT
jgi:hypothetical protein